MSYTNFVIALELAKKIENYRILGNVPIDKVQEAERLVGIKFSKQHFKYYLDIGILSFFGSEFYGISIRDFEGPPGSNAILLAMYEREHFGLPIKWIPIYFLDDGCNAYLDYSQLNAEGEPMVITGVYTGRSYEVTEIIAEDLGDFLLNVVNNYLQ